MTDGLTHFDGDGRAIMVDVSDKATTTRTAVARGRVEMSEAAFARLASGGGKKGEVGPVAELAGVMAAKRTADLVPLCHPLPLSNVKVEIVPDGQGASVTARVKTTGKTGVEMEALTAVSVACLTVYDMLKAVDKSMRITNVELVEKTGGESGDFKRSE